MTNIANSTFAVASLQNNGNHPSLSKVRLVIGYEAAVKAAVVMANEFSETEDTCSYIERELRQNNCYSPHPSIAVCFNMVEEPSKPKENRYGT